MASARRRQGVSRLHASAARLLLLADRMACSPQAFPSAFEPRAAIKLPTQPRRPHSHPQASDVLDLRHLCESPDSARLHSTATAPIARCPSEASL